MITATPLDDEVLVSLCGDTPGLFRLSVDDLYDPDEVEASHEEIHLTCVQVKNPEDVFPFCFRLSVVSALKLVCRLNVAIAQREGSSS